MRRTQHPGTRHSAPSAQRLALSAQHSASCPQCPALSVEQPAKEGQGWASGRSRCVLGLTMAHPLDGAPSLECHYHDASLVLYNPIVVTMPLSPHHCGTVPACHCITAPPLSCVSPCI